MAADEVVRRDLLDPAFGFGGLGFEFRDGLDGIAGGEDLGVLGWEFFGGVDGAGE